MAAHPIMLKVGGQERGWGVTTYRELPHMGSKSVINGYAAPLNLIQWVEL
jgi:hypothetical protein